MGTDRGKLAASEILNGDVVMGWWMGRERMNEIESWFGIHNFSPHFPPPQLKAKGVIKREKGINWHS